jgi:predicted Zn-dependent protease
LAVALNWKLRYCVFRFALFVLLLVPAAVFAQDPAQKPNAQAPAAAEPQPRAPVDSSVSAASESVSSQVAGAEVAIAKSDWKSAEAALDTWLASHSADPRALFDAGYVADAQNRADDAAALYRRAIEADPRSFEAHISLGLLLARQSTPSLATNDKLTEARAELTTATTLDPGDAGPSLKARAWRALAQIDRIADPTEASNDLLEALKLTPETQADTLLAANLAETAGQYDLAEAAYRRILAKDSKSPAANAGLAHLLIARKNYPEAETFLRAALLQAPDDLALNAQLATALAAQDKAEALPLLQKLHDGHPADPAIALMLAQVLADAGDPAASDRLYNALLAATPSDPALLIGHGQNLIRQLRYPEAFAAYDKATQLDPANPDGWSGLAFSASKTNQPSVTIHALTMRSKSLPEVPSTYFLWATSYDALHQRSQAISYYHQFLNSSGGKLPDQEWQARQRLQLLIK